MISSNQQFSPAPGGKLKGRYLIERELGRGGVGVVFLARDERLHGMPVVIKFLLDAAEQNKWLTGKFSQEAEALTRINHPGVVRVIDRDNSEDGRPFFVMEFIKGRSLREFINQGPMDLAYVARFARQTGSALHAAHQQGVFHRDLKPENVMLEQLSGGDEQVKLIDFGIAKVINPQAGNETEVAIVAGSRQYIAPEQLLSQTASPATDIYALAIIVYEMVTGRLPFNPQGATHFLVMQELMRLQRSESFTKPRAFRPDLPEAAQILLLNALSFDAARRPQNARIFTEDLAQAMLGKISADEARATIVIPPPDRPKAPDVPAALEPPNTEIYPVENTAAQATATAPNVVAQTSAPKSPPERIAPVPAGRDTVAKTSGRKFPVVPVLIIAIIAATAVIALKTLWPSVLPGSTAEVTPSPTPRTAAPSPAAPKAELTFIYWSTVRQKNFPGKAPFRIPGEMYFNLGDILHFYLTSPQTGYLYIINESPPVAGQTSSFNFLFPTTTTNQGSARISAGDKPLRIPDHNDGFVIDKEQGVEKLWLIWSASEVGDLEPLKRWANDKDKGEIKDAAEIGKLRDFLAKHSSATPQVDRDEDNKKTTVKMTGDILVKL
ncbi:MAG TPA: protein kinase, partial [Blastocatellia bacterium]|nr:protein kinase [Blastocatellia bacterium]